MGKHIDWYNADGERWCGRCGCYLSPDQFNRQGPNATTPDKRNIYCKYHQSQIRRACYQRTREKSRAYARAYRAAHPESGNSEAARQAKREYKLRQALADGSYARRLRRQARDERDSGRIRQWLKAKRAGQSAPCTITEVARQLGCSFRRARRLYVAAGGVVGGVPDARTEHAG